MILELLVVFVILCISEYINTDNLLIFLCLGVLISWINSLQQKINELTLHIKALKETNNSPQIINENPVIPPIQETKPKYNENNQTTTTSPTLKEAPQTQSIIKETASSLASQHDHLEILQPKVPYQRLKPTFNEPKTTNIFAWIAAFSAILGVFFLVKFLVNHGILTPSIRLTLLGLASFASIFGGVKILKHSDFANSSNISQVLIGVGITALYFISYSMSKLYFLIPENISFILMCITTALSIFVTIKTNQTSIAVLTLLGGFLTPMLVTGFETNIIHSSIYTLFIYITLIYCGIISKSICLIIISLAFIYLWGFIQLFSSFFVPFNTIWVMLTIFGITVFSVSSPQIQNSPNSTHLNFITTIMCCLFGFICLTKTNFGNLEWAMCGLILASLIFLSLNKPKVYISQSIICAITILSLMVFSQLSNKVSLPIFATISGLAIIPMYLFLLKSYNNLYHAIYIAIIGPIYFIGAYFLYKNEFNLTYIGILCSALLLIPTTNKKNYQQDYPAINGIVILSSITLLSISLCISLPVKMLIVLACVEILAFSSIKNYIKASFLEYGICTLLIWLSYLLFKPIVSTLIFLLPLSNFSINCSNLNIINIISMGLIPFICLSASHYISKDSKIRLLTAVLSIIFLFATTFSLILLSKTSSYPTSSYDIDISDYAIITDLLLLFVIIFRKKAPTLSHGILVLGGARAFLICLMLFFSFYNSDTLNVAYTTFIFIIQMSLLWLIYNYNNSTSLLRILTIQSFTLITAILNISFYNTPSFSTYNSHNNHIFAYSFSWLFLSILWLASAFYKKEMVKPAFGLLYFVIAKIFLYDVSNLSDFLRIISLFLLAGSLLLISHFYEKKFKEITNNP